jgi:hypothetical protein
MNGEEYEERADEERNCKRENLRKNGESWK